MAAAYNYYLSEFGVAACNGLSLCLSLLPSIIFIILFGGLIFDGLIIRTLLRYYIKDKQNYKSSYLLFVASDIFNT